MSGPLAVIGKIIDIIPIKNADRIVQATVVCGTAGKWTGVVPKDMELGKKVLVFLQDAKLPEDARWAFMEKNHWVVRMSRFRGTPSECLILEYSEAEKLDVGTDLTAELGVTKHEKSVPVSDGSQIAAFPSFISKTDEINFQASLDVDRMTEDPFYITEKADGTSGTAWVDEDGVLHVCSRSWELAEFNESGKTNVYWRAAQKYGMDKLPLGTALQFEVVGPGIQKNQMGLEDLEVRAFNLWATKYYCCLPYQELVNVCSSLDIPLARLIKKSAPLGEIPTADDLRKLAEIQYENGKPAEGIVIRAMDSSWSFKVINLLYKE